jgi:hypothetical protein
MILLVSVMMAAGLLDCSEVCSRVESLHVSCSMVEACVALHAAAASVLHTAWQPSQQLCLRSPCSCV